MKAELQPSCHVKIGVNVIAMVQEQSHANTVETVHSGHPSGPNKLVAIERWPDYTVEPV